MMFHMEPLVHQGHAHTFTSNNQKSHFKNFQLLEAKPSESKIC
jgi:hypothetical protein